MNGKPVFNPRSKEVYVDIAYQILILICVGCHSMRTCSKAVKTGPNPV